jgi:cell cycle sensor histidine kinase DivJ
LAASLTGGLSGPLAIWCAAPMTAAVVLGGRRRIAGGAALSLLAAVVTALAQADRLVVPPPEGALGTGLAMIGVLSIAIGLAAALLMTEQGSARQLEARSRETARMREAVDEHPHLIVTVHGSGRVEGVYGAPERLGISALRLTEGGLASIVDEADRTVLNAALGTAITTAPPRSPSVGPAANRPGWRSSCADCLRCAWWRRCATRPPTTSASSTWSRRRSTPRR